jgi:hypothetical protein
MENRKPLTEEEKAERFITGYVLARASTKPSNFDSLLCAHDAFRTYRFIQKGLALKVYDPSEKWTLPDISTSVLGE